MCGIIGAAGVIPAQKKFESARDVLQHRGPNAGGIMYDEKNAIALGHRRLSIIDLTDAGTQPFYSADGRYCLVFNGEIYNYIELKKELSSSYHFVTRTDTEVLLAAYIVWGTACLDRFNGMFAFALYDTQRKELFCARDRLGIKPFYYFYNDSRFIFASEIKALLALDVPARPNDAILYDYLAFGYYDHTSETMFESIHQLPAGYYGIYAASALRLTRWWYLPDKQPPQERYYARQEDAQEALRTLLADSIRLCFRSDVPVGVNVSSGLDSISLLFFAEHTTQQPLHLFSMCYPDPQFDECPYIKNVLNSTQLTRWHTSTLERDEVWGAALAMVRIQDQPFGGIPTLAYAKLNRQAYDEGTIVLLEGQGVDELLAGYAYYRPSFLRSHALSQDATKHVYDVTLASTFVARHHDRSPDCFKKPFGSPLLNAQFRDMVHTKLPRVLRFNDHVSMAFGRELRLPYLDYRLVEMLFYLPDDFKINGDEQKVLLRRAMAQHVPDAVRQKQKIAFGAVQTPWLQKGYQKEIMSLLTSESFYSRPYFDHARVQEKLGSFFKSGAENSFFVWQWINLELWFRAYID